MLSLPPSLSFSLTLGFFSVKSQHISYTLPQRRQACAFFSSKALRSWFRSTLFKCTLTTPETNNPESETQNKEFRIYSSIWSKVVWFLFPKHCIISPHFWWITKRRKKAKPDKNNKKKKAEQNQSLTKKKRLFKQLCFLDFTVCVYHDSTQKETTVFMWI